MIHGDLTYENIMFKDSEIKIIDMDGSRIFDAKEFDLGKLSQSILSNYNNWKKSNNLIHGITDNGFNCENKFFKLIDNHKTKSLFSVWGDILNKDIETVKRKAIFYMSTYFIRFVPFRMQESRDHGIFALLMAIVWLSKLLNGEKNEN